MGLFTEEIAAQPEVARARLERWSDVLAAATELVRADPAVLLVAARGSSDHASTYAKYVFETRNRLPVALAAPSAFTIYDRPPALGRAAVLAISQSGGSPDVVAVLAAARRGARPAIAIVNDTRSPLAEAAGQVVEMMAGRERSIAASKTYTAALACVAMLSLALEHGHPVAELAAVPAALEAGLRVPVEPLADAVEGDRLLVIGRGYQLATAKEVALKVTEVAGVLATASSPADFRHGPIAAVRPGQPVLLLEARGPAQPDLGELRTRLRALGATVLRFTDDASARADPAAALIECGLEEWLTPLPFAVAGQRLAAALAAARGLDPDRPPGLEKVTRTY